MRRSVSAPFAAAVVGAIVGYAALRYYADANNMKVYYRTLPEDCCGRGSLSSALQAVKICGNIAMCHTM
jgi:hypothetical protein